MSWAGALLALVACASIAGIEDPDPASGGGAGGPDGGVQLGDGISITPESVTITTSCTGSGESRYITLTNQTDADTSYELQIPEGSAFALRDASDASTPTLKGTLAAKQVLIVYLRVTATTAGTHSGQIIARVGERVTQLPVVVTVNGGSLAFSPTLIDFGEVRKDTNSPTQVVQLENTGTEKVNVIGFGVPAGAASGTDFTTSLASGSLVLDPGAKTDVTTMFVAGPPGPQITTVFEPRTETPTCGALPKLTLKGTRVNQDVTVNPVLLNFGDVDCSSAGGATKTISISNYSGGLVPFTVSTASTRYSVAPPSGTVPAANGSTPGKVDVVVTLKAVGAALDTYNDTIEVETSGPQARKTSVAISLKTVGATVSVQPTTLTGFGGDEIESFTVKNTGNKFIYLQHASSDSNAFRLVNNSDNSPLYPGISLSVSVKSVAQGSGPHSATVTTTRRDTPVLSLFPSSAVLCEPAAVVTANK